MSALGDINAAMQEAELVLPPEVTKHHWAIAQAHPPDSWNQTYWWYRTQDWDLSTADTISDLVGLSECRERLKGMVARKVGLTATPKLARVRRSNG